MGSKKGMISNKQSVVGKSKHSNDDETYIKYFCNALSVIHFICIGVLMSLPQGTFLPGPGTAIHATTMLLMCVVHGVYCFGAYQSIGFFITAMIVEWSFEQANISFGGFIFGKVIYNDELLGPKLGDVPIFVPVGIYFMCWPSYVMGNIIMHQKVVVLKEDSIFQLIWRCFIYSMIHTAWSLAIDPACLRYGFYTYTETEAVGGHIPMSDTYWGVPISEFQGWTVMVFTQWFLFLAFISPFLPAPIRQESFKRRIERFESFHLTPVFLYAGFTLLLISNPINKALGAITFWVMGMPVLFALYQWYNHYSKTKTA